MQLQISKVTHRPQSSSFLGLVFRILYGNPKKELLWGLWAYVSASTSGFQFEGLGGRIVISGLRV